MISDYKLENGYKWNWTKVIVIIQNNFDKDKYDLFKLY